MLQCNDVYFARYALWNQHFQFVKCFDFIHERMSATCPRNVIKHFPAQTVRDTRRAFDKPAHLQINPGHELLKRGRGLYETTVSGLKQSMRRPPK